MMHRKCPEFVILGIGRNGRMGPRGIDLEMLMEAVTEAPHQQEAVPPAIERNLLEQPLHVERDRAMVIFVRNHPLRRALEDLEMLDLGSDRRAHLHSARTGTDNGD